MLAKLLLDIAILFVILITLFTIVSKYCKIRSTMTLIFAIEWILKIKSTDHSCDVTISLGNYAYCTFES